MPGNVLHKASDLPPKLRQAVGRLLGRALEPEEHVSVTAYRPHKAPTGKAQVELAGRLKERIDKAAERLKDVPAAEVDELIDEAVDHVRHHRREGRSGHRRSGARQRQIERAGPRSLDGHH